MKCSARTIRIARFGLVAAGIPTLLVATAAAASAHVSVNPDSAPAGGYSKLTFKVPNESDTASTTKLRVVLPTEHPLTSVSVQPRAGWTYQVKTTKLSKPLTDHDGNEITQAVSEVNWTAESAATAIKPGEFDEFSISVGPLPDSGSMTFKALQTYSDGSVARWIDEDESGEKPAPTLDLTGDAGETVGAGHHDEAGGDGHTAAADGAEEPEAASKTPLVLSIIAIVVAVFGAGLGVLRRRS
ncbi:YcnI family protein [Nocardioides sp. KC13]|uniref:YcnI family protein n=1 Tax=Nocardioides turkmenicus TaxID=2711220 RepID=A0A6M1RDK5_9ACTN|nr:YcnI family protein [Nocardioides sp. KC13]NGN95748.1 YcnI family protein [Nocardioides sp. KC13]